MTVAYDPKRWHTACNGDNKRYPWFVTRDVDGRPEYATKSNGVLIRRFATREAAQVVADRLNPSADYASARVHLRAAIRHLTRATDQAQPTDPRIVVLGVLADVALRLNGDPGDPPSESEVMHAIGVLAATERYSVKDNDNDDWIA